MIRSILIGLATGQRSLTPIAVVAHAARRGRAAPLPLLSNPIVATGLAGLAAAEMGGDKMKSAPDRIVPIGMAVRLITGAFAGAAVARQGHRRSGAALGAAAAVIGAYVGFDLRMRALRRYGQTPSGLVEDALTLASALAVTGGGRRAAPAR
ncbi:DUF4126 domain-containing protein [Caulobacter sp. 73W]|uniref:DUF4126 domain-containing protein n=1 Tax=Caulobacter sp. 73W TaxID=3161137 RepID=A0AB39KQW4_9CAUL